MKEMGRIKDRHEFSFDSRQLGLVLFGAAALAALVFVLGVSVGIQWERKKGAEANSTDVAAKTPVRPGVKPPDAQRAVLPVSSSVKAAARPSAPPVPPPVSLPSDTPQIPAAQAAPETVAEKKPVKSPVKSGELTFPKVLTSNTKGTAPLLPDKAKKPAGRYTIQVGAYKESSAADARAGRLRNKGYDAKVYSAGSGVYAYKVRVGSFESRDEAKATAKKLAASEGVTPFVTKDSP